MTYRMIRWRKRFGEEGSPHAGDEHPTQNQQNPENESEESVNADSERLLPPNDPAVFESLCLVGGIEITCCCFGADGDTIIAAM
jgi:hypothetical protein